LKSELNKVFDKLSELKQKLQDCVTTEGSVRERLDKRERLIAEYGRALGGLEELIIMKDEVLKLAGDLESQLQQMKDQLNQEKQSTESVESQLLEAKQRIEKTLDDFAAANKRAESLSGKLREAEGKLSASNKRAERLDTQGNSLEKATMDIENELDEWKQKLKEVNATVDTLRKQIQKKTDFFQSKVDRLLGELSETKLEVTNKECELYDQNTENKLLQSKYEEAQRMINQQRKLKADLANQLDQLRSNVAALEAQLTKVSDKLEQNTGEKAEMETKIKNISQELEKKGEQIRECNQKICELEELQHRDEREKSLNDRLKQAEKDAHTQRQLLRQHSEEIRHIKREKDELERKLAAEVSVEPCGKDVYDFDVDNMPTDRSDHSEIGMYVIYNKSLM